MNIGSNQREVTLKAAEMPRITSTGASSTFSKRDIAGGITSELATRLTTFS